MTSTQGSFVAVVLAAGQGQRMKSTLPKVLHPLVGRPMLTWPVQAALDAGAARCIVVVAPGREDVQKTLHERFGSRVHIAIQDEPKGTGHAVQVAVQRDLKDWNERVLVLYGDCPLVRSATLSRLMEEHSKNNSPLALITSLIDDPTGYGRVLRNAGGAVIGVREHRDCNDVERTIREINAGFYNFDAAFLKHALTQLAPANSQGELYLTDTIVDAAQRGTVASIVADLEEMRGVNDRYQLAECNKILQLRIHRAHAERGITIRDPQSTWIDADVAIAHDATIEPMVSLRGHCQVGSGSRIDVGCVLTDVEVGEGAYIRPYVVASSSKIGDRAQVGPFSHLRPDSELGSEVHVGNFVETKKTKMARGAKANHLSYLGDGVIGSDVNVGAGTIFCNYDGVRKHTTVLEDGCFIGSDSQLVAPVTVGKNAYVATGTTVTQDVPVDALAIGRARQVNKEGYASRLRKQFQSKK